MIQTEIYASQEDEITKKILFKKHHKKGFAAMSNDDKLQIIYDRIADLKEDIKDVKTDVEDIRSKLYHPDDGLYARIKKTDNNVITHQNKFSRIEKFVYLGVGSLITGGIGVAIKLIFGI